MFAIGEPDQECSAKAILATLGSTTTTTKKSTPVFLQGDGTIYGLPCELHVNIMADLANDPVSQVCFGLASSYFYKIFHEVRDERCENEERRYNIKTHPLDLAMQVSVCGRYSLFGWYEYWNLIDCTDIDWERTLGERLSGEIWLWRDLVYCQCCRKYKPAAAFENSAFEQRMFEEHREKLKTLEGSEVMKTANNCQRCRAKALLVFLTKRDEVMEFPHPFEESRSLGLAKPATTSTDVQALAQADSWETRDAISRGYERWEDIFAELGI